MFGINDKGKKNPLVRDLLAEFKQRNSTKSNGSAPAGDRRPEAKPIMARTLSVENTYEVLPSPDTISDSRCVMFEIAAFLLPRG